jgi:predicted nucleotidyltransferase
MNAELKGENQIEGFRKVAGELISRIVRCKGVAGVVFIGGLVRGFADRFSDVDVIVFMSKEDEKLRKRICEVGVETEKRWKADVDLEVHYLEDFKKWKWDEADRWEFSRADVVFDPNGEVKKVFREKLRLPRDFWVRRIAVCAEYLKWYCCPPRRGVGTIAEAWIERGDLTSAQYCLSYGVELLIKMVFALNKEFLPAPKWRLFCSYALRWLPEDYEELVRQALIISEFSLEDFNRREKAIRDLWLESKRRIEEETGLSLKQLSEYYVEKVLHQSWTPPSLDRCRKKRELHG